MNCRLSPWFFVTFLTAACVVLQESRSAENTPGAQSRTISLQNDGQIEPVPQPTPVAARLVSAAAETVGCTCGCASDSCQRCGGNCDKCGETSACDGCASATGCCSNCRQKQPALAAAVAGAFKPLFYDNNFDYLCDPCYSDWWPGESLKRMGIGDWLCLDVGGQFRLRQHAERNHRGLGLTGIDDDFLLYRTRLYLNGEFGDTVRVYAEYIDAESNYENFPLRPIEVNRSDMLNLFGDLKVYDDGGGALWTRAGRQELLYGNERVISPLDWANTRRTFEGYKMFWQGADWNVDGFYTRPIFPNAIHFDSPDYDQEFMGFYSTYKGRPNQTRDFYYLRYNNGDRGFKYDTLGARWQAASGDWLGEAEGAFQFGDNNDGSDHSAGFFVVGLGRRFDRYAWKPTLWAYFDWASGTNDRGASHGYDHMFPLAHKYLGFMDLYGRQNIETPNLLLTMSPHEKITLLFWYYYFYLENKNDTPYSVVMTPFNAANTPVSAYLGQEIDATATWKLNPRTGLLFGYSHFFSGGYYHLTPGVPYRGDANFFYTQFTVNF